MAIKVLHLLSNWKWTERSEPAVELALAQSRLGAKVIFGCGRGPEDYLYNVAYHARQKGLESVCILDLPKHFQVFAALSDAKTLHKLLADFRPTIIHCHMANAHLQASFARRFSRFPLIVRSCYNPEGPQTDLRSRFLYRFYTDGLVVINQTAKTKAIDGMGLSPEAIQIAEPGIDLQRFSPQRKIDGDRTSFGLKDEHLVIGVVSRIRASRRIDIVLEAVKMLAEEFPQLRLLIVGRGRRGAVEAVIEKPALKMNIMERIVLAGYCLDDRLVAAFRAMDVLVYPTSGTDKTCRTVREALASGVPVIAPRNGFLFELIEDNLNGRLMDFSVQTLSDALAELFRDKAKLQKLAHHALELAKTRFPTSLQARRVIFFYEKMLKSDIRI